MSHNSTVTPSPPPSPHGRGSPLEAVEKSSPLPWGERQGEGREKALPFALARIGLEAGSLSQWLHAGLKEAGFAVELLETRHVRDAFKAMPVKTDRNRRQAPHRAADNRRTTSHIHAALNATRVELSVRAAQRPIRWKRCRNCPDGRAGEGAESRGKDKHYAFYGMVERI